MTRQGVRSGSVVRGLMPSLNEGAARMAVRCSPVPDPADIRTDGDEAPSLVIRGLSARTDRS